MKQQPRNLWFWLACGFLIVNTYGVLQIGRQPSETQERHDVVRLSTERTTLDNAKRPITLDNVIQVDMDDQHRVILALIFNRPVSPQVLQRFISVTDSHDEKIQAQVQDRGPSQRVFLAVESKPSASLTLTVAKGFYAEEGPERLSQDIIRGILLQPDIALTSLRVQTPPLTPPTLSLNFSRPVELTSLRRSISTDPPANLIVTHRPRGRYGNTYLVTGNLHYNRNYTLTINSGLRAQDSTIRMHHPIEQFFTIPDAAAAIRIPVEGRFMSSNGSMLLPLESINVTNFIVKAARLPAHNLVQFAMREGRHYKNDWGHAADHITVPAAEKNYTLSAPANSNILHHVSMRELLPEDTPNGAWYIRVEADNQTRDQRLLVISDIGITVRHTAREMLVWANSIKTLDPIPHATVQVWSEAAEAIVEAHTDTQGLARVELEGDRLKPFMLTVRADQDLAFISLQDSLIQQPSKTATRPYLTTPDMSRAGKAQEPSLTLPLEAFLYTDRGVYRPGETTHARAIVRSSHLVVPQPMPVVLHAFRPDGREHSQQTSMLSDYGTTEFAIDWESFDATGRYRLELRTPGAAKPLGSTTIAIEEFVPPRLAVTLDANIAPSEPFATASIAARYLYGAPASNNRFDMTLHALPLDFKPSNFADYVFGDTDRSIQTSSHPIASGHLTEDGVADLSFGLPASLRPPSMIEAILTATVHEQGGRTVSAASRTPMHVYPYYIGIHKNDFLSIETGKDQDVHIQLVEPSGRKHTANVPLTVVVEQIEWSTVLTRDSRGRYRYESHRRISPVKTDVISTDANGSARYKLDTTLTGSLRLRVASDSGSATVHAYHVGRTGWRDRAMDRPDRVELHWDRPSYRPGDIAKLTVVSPFPGRALLVVEQDKLLFKDTSLMQDNTMTFSVPVTREFFPNAHASVHVIRNLPQQDPTGSRMAARAIGSIPLRLDASPYQLQVQLTAPETIKPETRLPISLDVRAPDDSPVQAEVAIAVVDEAICMLSDFRTPNPIEHFMALRQLPFQVSDLYAMLLPESDPEMAKYHAHTGGDIASLLRGRLNPVRSRRFRPLAIWHKAVETDSDGRATVEIPIPEFSGQVRIMAVAVSREHKGSAQQSVTINRPLTVLASLPRFLGTGDSIQMPIELHYNGVQNLPIALHIETEGPVKLEEDIERKLTLTPGERLSIAVPLQATSTPGNARITVQVVTPNGVITDTVAIPVRPPAALRSRHTPIALNAGETIELPSDTDWYPATLSQSIHLSSDATIGLAGAYDYLTRYPYGCLEQILSTAFAVMYTKDLLLHDETGFIISDSEAYLRGVINRVLSMQTSNGGFGWWPHARTTYDWGTLYAMHFLVLAQNQGFTHPTAAYERGLQYLRGLLARPTPSPLPSVSEAWQQDASLRAYTCYVLALAGHPNHSWTERLREQVERMNLDSRLHLVLALAAGGRRRDAYALLQSLDHAPLPGTVSDSGCLKSPARSIAYRLAAWLEIAPDHPSIPRQTEALLAHQHDGRWRTTQENAAALMALSRYHQLNKETPRHFSATLKQNNQETELSSEHKAVPLDATGTIFIQNDGPGRLYATLRQKGIPKNSTEDSDDGIRIRRSYWTIEQEHVDSSTLRQGDLIIVALQIDTLGTKLDNLVIADLLPAGMEIENSNLRSAELIPWAKTQSNLPVRHVDLRDDRIVIFTEAFSGKRQFYYAVRAVTPGIYTRPPVTIEGMYAPERNSTHHAGTLTIVAP